MAFDLDSHIDELQDRINAGRCELTGFAFDLSGGQRQFASPSIDRIKPELGYVLSNVRVICYGMNAALGNWGESALKQMVAAWIGNAINPVAAAEVIRAWMECS